MLEHVEGFIYNTWRSTYKAYVTSIILKLYTASTPLVIIETKGRCAPHPPRRATLAQRQYWVGSHENTADARQGQSLYQLPKFTMEERLVPVREPLMEASFFPKKGVCLIGQPYFSNPLLAPYWWPSSFCILRLYTLAHVASWSLELRSVWIPYTIDSNLDFSCSSSHGNLILKPARRATEQRKVLLPHSYILLFYCLRYIGISGQKLYVSSVLLSFLA